MRAQLGISYVVIGLLCFADSLGGEQVVVYSSVKEVIAGPLTERFEKQTGTAVRLVSANPRANSKELFDRLTAGKKDSDEFWSRDSVDAMF
jgi:iron(III) transport system substrate-binding protein